MGKSSHPITTRLGYKNIFWNSELYSYYYKNCIKDYLKVSLILDRLFKKFGLSILSFKLYFLNNVFLIISLFKRYYWKYNCIRLKFSRNFKCPFLIKGSWRRCKNIQCSFFNKKKTVIKINNNIPIDKKLEEDEEGAIILVKKFLSENAILQKLPKKPTKRQRALYFQRLKRDSKDIYTLNRRYSKVWKFEFSTWRNKSWLGRRKYMANNKNNFRYNKEEQSKDGKVSNHKTYNKHSFTEHNNKITNITSNLKIDVRNNSKFKNTDHNKPLGGTGVIDNKGNKFLNNAVKNNRISKRIENIKDKRNM